MLKLSLAVVLTLFLFGIVRVSPQQSSSDLLLTLAVGGLAGWALSKHVQRNRRQDAINELLLSRAARPAVPGGWNDPYYNDFSRGPGFGDFHSGDFHSGFHDRRPQRDFSVGCKLHYTISLAFLSVSAPYYDSMLLDHNYRSVHQYL